MQNKEPSVSEVAAEVLKALGGAISKEFERLFSDTKYTGDTYYDNPTPKSIFFDTKIATKREPLPEVQMKNRNFYPKKTQSLGTLSDDEFDIFVNDLKDYAKKLEIYDYPKTNGVRFFQEVSNIVKDIRKHVEKNGSYIVIDDDMTNSYFGYKCKNTNIRWRIPHEPVLEYFTDLNNPPDILDTFYLNTGKRALNNEEFLKDVFAKITDASGEDITQSDLKEIVDMHITKEQKDKVLEQNERIEDQTHKASLLSGKVWEDAKEMFDDIIAHVKKHGGNIIQADNPKQLRMGFVCQTTGRWWEIRISKIRKFPILETFHISDLDHLVDYLNKQQNDIPAETPSTQASDTQSSLGPMLLFAGVALGGFLSTLKQTTEQIVRVKTNNAAEENIEQISVEEEKV